MPLDRYDQAILTAIQKDGRLSNQDLAKTIGLSAAPCWRRLKRLEDEGYITGYMALINPKKIGLQVIAFAEVSLDNHHPSTLDAFNKLIQSCPEIQECHSVTGRCDYLLKIATRDMQAYEELLSNRILQITGIRSINTMFSLKTSKLSRELPID